MTLTISASKSPQKGENLGLPLYKLVSFSFQILWNSQILNHCVFLTHPKRSPRNGAQQQSAADVRRYRLLDEIEGQTARNHFYVMVNMTDEVMGIGNSDMTDARNCSLAQRFYVSELGFKFPIEIFKYRRGGSK